MAIMSRGIHCAFSHARTRSVGDATVNQEEGGNINTLLFSHSLLSDTSKMLFTKLYERSQPQLIASDGAISITCPCLFFPLSTALSCPLPLLPGITFKLATCHGKTLPKTQLSKPHLY